MLEAITDNGYLHWRCVMLDSLDGELISCGEHKTCHIDEAVYRFDGWRNKGRDLSAVIVLPKCACGVQMTLKADFTLRELWHEAVIFTDEQHVPQVYTLPLEYVRSLRAHWMLYERGRAEHAPVLPMPSQDVLEHPQFAQISNPDGIYALWFGFAVARQYVPALSGIDLPMLLSPAK